MKIKTDDSGVEHKDHLHQAEENCRVTETLHVSDNTDKYTD